MHFVEHQVNLLSDPQFGDIQPAERGIHVKRNASAFKPKIRREKFATKVYAVNKQPQHKDTKEINLSNIRCLFCSQRHSVDDCTRFTKIKHCDKINFLMEKGACFRCLNTGYSALGIEAKIVRNT